jgi:pyrrolidone-carboxylate peptidase
MHVPLTPEQVLRAHRDLPSMPKSQAAEAINRVVDMILQPDLHQSVA